MSARERSQGASVRDKPGAGQRKEDAPALPSLSIAPAALCHTDTSGTNSGGAPLYPLLPNSPLPPGQGPAQAGWCSSRLQSTLEQCGFELHGSSYTQIFVQEHTVGSPIPWVSCPGI